MPHWEVVHDLTDVSSGPELIDKAFSYMNSLTKECRKALTNRFEHAHRGISFDSVEPTIRKEVESWFAERDKKITIKHEKSGIGRPGQVLIVYSGATNYAQFKFYVDGLFTKASLADNSPSYLKTLNVYVDKRDFTR